MPRSGRRSLLGLFLVPLVVSILPVPGASAEPKALGHNRHPKLDSVLVSIDRTAHERGNDAAIAEARSRGVAVQDGKVHVVLQGTRGNRSGARNAAVVGRGRVTAEYADLVSAYLPPGALRGAAERDDVRYVRLPLPWRATAINGEGVPFANAGDFFRNGNRGAGVKIAIIDGGFSGYTTWQGTGDLPATLHTQDFCPTLGFNSTDHGTAVAEIVHEMAPDAELYLICMENEVTLGQAMEYAHTNGVHVINHSIAWYNSSRGDGSGAAGSPDAIARTAKQTHGMVWVNAAGNEGETHWMGSFFDSNGDNLHNYTSGDQANDFLASSSGGEVLCTFLKWDAWQTSSQIDFDLVVTRNGVPTNIVSENDQYHTTAPPVEGGCFETPSAGTYGVAIYRYYAPTSPRMDLFVVAPSPQYRTATSSIVEPASSPHVFAAGAICWTNGGLQPYSSRGPTIAGLHKPDIAGPDSVSGGTYGAFGGCGTVNGFAGTSAASPHVAGAAALVKDANPSFSAAQLQSYLELRALDLGTGGDDDSYGWGRLWSRAFRDVPTSDYAYTAVESLFDSGITTGCTYFASTTDRRYCPANNVTRAEMAPFLVKAMGLGPCTNCATPTFTDVPTSHWAYGWIEQLVDQGVTAGCSTNPRRYCPDDPVTRAQMAPFIMKAVGLGQCTNCATPTFTDVPTSYWAYGWIEQLVDQGVTAGCSTTPKRYCPESNVIRRDMALFIMRAFELLDYRYTGVGGAPLTDLVFSPDGTRLYLSNAALDRVEVYNVTTGAMLTPISVGDSPHGLDISADGTTLYVANRGSSTISVVTVATGNAAVINVPADPDDIDHPLSLALTNTGDLLFSRTWSGNGGSGAISVIDLGTTTITPLLGSQPRLPYLEPSGDRSKVGIAFGDSSGGPVRFYTASDGTLSSAVNLGSFIRFIGVNGNGSRYLVGPGTFVLDGSLGTDAFITGGLTGLGVALPSSGSIGYRSSFTGIDVLDLTAEKATTGFAVGDTFASAGFENAIGRLAISPDGSRLAVITDHGFSVIETS